MSAVASADSIQVELTRPSTKIVFQREISLKDANRGDLYCSNEVITSQYTVYDFLPKQLWEQFHQPSNLYFLIISIMQCFKEVSDANGVPTNLLPLSFILIVSGIRAALEDYARHVMDEKDNSKLVSVLKPEYEESSLNDANIANKTIKGYSFQKVPSSSVKVGDIVRIYESEMLPADLICLYSANSKGFSWVETASLDGETGLKVKTSVADYQVLFSNQDIVKSCEQIEWIKLEEPNSKLDHFKGRISINQNDSVALSISNLLLRGTVLKNTESCVGIVAYTGADTKIRKNCQFSSSTKYRSTTSNQMDLFMISMLFFQLAICIFLGVADGVMTNQLSSAWYLSYSDMNSIGLEAFLRTITWIIILSQMVPISLLVSVELVKAGQAYFMSKDASLNFIKVQNTVVNEDLGQVEYLFSDKTGTLTKNRMEFKAAVINEQVFGSFDTEIARRVHARTSSRVLDKGRRVSTYLGHRFSDSDISSSVQAIETKEPAFSPTFLFKRSISLIKKKSWTDLVKNLVDSPEVNSVLFSSDDVEILRENAVPIDPNPFYANNAARRYLTHLAISNTIVPVEIDGKIQYQATSPDELALCNFAKRCGFELVSRNPITINVTTQLGPIETETYVHLGTMEFNSKRKRVTVIVQSSNSIHLMCKGADNVMSHVVSPVMAKQLTQMSEAGLRTLVLAYADLPLSWWDGWKDLFQNKLSQTEEGNEQGHSTGSCSALCSICDVFDQIEKSSNMIALGATGLEDKLGDLVPECIEDFLVANIKVWMLTGDKRETAKNIGLACNLIDPANPGELIPRFTEIVGRWYEIKHDSELAKKLFFYLDEKSSGRIQCSELIRSLKLLDPPISDSSMDLLYHFGNHISLERFLDWFQNLGFSYFDSVVRDIDQGIKMAMIAQERKLDSISMVLDGKALSALFPPPRQSPASVLSPTGDAENTNFNPALYLSTVKTPSPSETVDLEKFARQESFNDYVEETSLTLARDLFFNLASLCKSVIACRLTPDQKALIVAEIKRRKGALTCSIGDGANDELMIRCANVGVGISGLEGSAYDFVCFYEIFRRAARAADYAIDQFRYLHTLLFVYGFWNHRRISSLIYYIFYKSMVVAFLNVLFAFNNSYSGLSFFDDSLVLLYSLLFSSCPIIVLSIMDQSLGRKMLEDTPILYYSVSKNRLFTLYHFVGWMSLAFFHGFIAFFMSYFAVAFDSSADGKPFDFVGWSTLAFTSLVIVVNVQVVYYMHSITYVHAAFVIGTVLVYFLVLLLLSSGPFMATANPNFFGVPAYYFNSELFWLGILLIVLSCILVSYTKEHLQRLFKPTALDVFQERYVLAPEELSKLEADDPGVFKKFRIGDEVMEHPRKIFTTENCESYLEFLKYLTSKSK